jgi:glutamine amidotransferase
VCRVVAYLGRPLPLDVLLYRSDSALVHQVYAANGMATLNLAGCGVGAWDPAMPNPHLPLIYRDTTLPMYDGNLKRISQKVTASCALCHIRGANYRVMKRRPITKADLHPFQFDGVQVTFAHNGALARFDEMKYSLLEFIEPKFSSAISGTTDSEWMYAVMLSQLEDPTRLQSAGELEAGMIRTLEIVQEVRAKHGIDTLSAANLFATDGRSLVATRFVFDFGWLPKNFAASHMIYNSLWYTMGERYEEDGGAWHMQGSTTRPEAVLVASEPLTDDTSRWIEVPEYTLLKVTPDGDHLNVTSSELTL